MDAPIVQITIDFDAQSKQMLWQLSETLGTFRDYRPFWHERGGVVDLIRRDIEENILQGVDPDLKTWALLSPSYQRVVHRPRMELSQNAINAYARMAHIRADAGFLVFEPNADFEPFAILLSYNIKYFN